VYDLYRNGYALAELVLSQNACERLIDALPHVDAGRGGLRNLIDDETVVRVIRDERFAAAIASAAEPGLVAVKATLFDKTPRANWRVAWHQDRAVAVREQRDVDGFGPWSVKRGVPHVEPPASVLERMVAVRIQLDDCGAGNGPLRVIRRSHRGGKLTDAQLAEAAATGPVAVLALPQGSLLLMRPLLVHASSPAETPAHRRVLHIELAPRDAIGPLEWYRAVPLA
jgi:ectoine hydroxylase-related dioxygenase (phytanoyl-CoA dioxygenase family)